MRRKSSPPLSQRVEYIRHRTPWGDDWCDLRETALCKTSSVQDVLKHVRVRSSIVVRLKTGYYRLGVINNGCINVWYMKLLQVANFFLEHQSRFLFRRRAWPAMATVFSRRVHVQALVGTRSTSRSDQWVLVFPDAWKTGFLINSKIVVPYMD